ncbi:hypothetical protein M0804_004096 [Polistes exclamans]|nr:hypothetical protein M0804_004096 [Polistes exclamans]
MVGGKKGIGQKRSHVFPSDMRCMRPETPLEETEASRSVLVHGSVYATAPQCTAPQCTAPRVGCHVRKGFLKGLYSSELAPFTSFNPGSAIWKRRNSMTVEHFDLLRIDEPKMISFVYRKKNWLFAVWVKRNEGLHDYRWTKTNVRDIKWEKAD